MVYILCAFKALARRLGVNYIEMRDGGKLEYLLMYKTMKQVSYRSLVVELYIHVDSHREPDHATSARTKGLHQVKAKKPLYYTTL